MEKKNLPILIVGNGPMAAEYAKVLREGMKRPFAVVGRNGERAQEFATKYGANESASLDKLTANWLERFSYAIVTTSRDSLQPVSEQLLTLSSLPILIEKPVSLSFADAKKIASIARSRSVRARVAYNRRFYASVETLRAKLAESPAVGAFFDFTELPHTIPVDKLPPTVSSRWAFGNSVHVFDTVRFLLGEFRDLRAQITGKGELPWHPSGSQFFGSAICGELPVSYASSWICPGRWDIQVFTRAGRFKLSPMEKLQIMRPKSFQWDEVDLDDSLDKRFKPGLFRMLEAFETGEDLFPDLDANAELLRVISEAVGYPL